MNKTIKIKQPHIDTGLPLGRYYGFLCECCNEMILFEDHDEPCPKRKPKTVHIEEE